jgi:gluconate:H+ symporter, GntP family
VVGLVLGIPTWYVASYLFSKWIGQRTFVPVPDVLAGGEGASGRAVEFDDDPDADETGGSSTRTRAPAGARTAPPRFSTVLLLLLLPLVLILLNTGLNTLATAGVVDGDTATVGALRLFGQTPVALLITVLVAMVVLGRERFSRAEVEGIVNSSLGPVCAIILITGAAALRVAQGSATVALTTTAGLIAPIVAAEGLSSFDLACVVIAIAAGSTVLSHVNDSGFWLVGRFLEMDAKTTLKTWTVMETLIGLVGFALVLVASLIL